MTSTDIFYYIACGVIIIGTLTGIAMMSKVKTAVAGNKLGAVSILAAVVLTLWYKDILTFIPLLVVVVISIFISILWSVKIKMIAMPQTVALLNGFGGAASAIVGGVFLYNTNVLLALTGVYSSHLIPHHETSLFTNFTSALAIAVGTLTLTGSLIAVGKLSGKLSQKPVILPLHRLITVVFIFNMVMGIIVTTWGNAELWSILLLTLFSAFFGIVFAVRIGGADMPITISLLNSLTGIALAAAGMSVGDPMLIAVGGIVGSAGLLLTQIMCRGMNRSLIDILTGKTTVSKSGTLDIDKLISSHTTALSKSDHTKLLKNAKKVIIIPGYGTALSGAQGVIKELSGVLEETGTHVDFTIHPVAGRTAGHMNVLLADADIPYEKLREFKDVNANISEYDAAIVIGANDIVNPAARSAEGTSIYGLPILAVDEVKNVIICNFDDKPGYAGVNNPLYKSDNVTLLLGDAKETVRGLIDELTDNDKTGDATEDVENAVRRLSEAENVIIIPGYGMALAQAQGLVKDLSDKLEQKGVHIDFAIHPVAGRMPGHMNVLLAEVNVPYNKLREMNDINPQFGNCDVAVIVGANDVVNPAARDAEGTPIYGMPILSADEAKHIVIFNYDTKPGYAGVDNPLYKSSKTTLLLGDAALTLKNIINKLN